MAYKKDTPIPVPAQKVHDRKSPRFYFLDSGKRIMKQMTNRIKSIYKPTVLAKIEEYEYDTGDNFVIILQSDWTKYNESEVNINRILYHISRKPKGECILLNKISTTKERKKIITFGKMLSKINKYQTLATEQIYLILIFCYYGINLIEQYWDWLTFKHIKIYFCKDQIKIALQLIFDISAGDIMTLDGRNLSSEIRRAFLGFGA